jgi:hypothetical protein
MSWSIRGTFWAAAFKTIMQSAAIDIDGRMSVNSIARENTSKVRVVSIPLEACR